MSEATRSAFAGLHVTHVKARPDAVIHNGREFVPTVYTRSPEENTKWVGTIDELRAVGGTFTFNEDQTEIWLTLPEGFKFSTGMFGVPTTGKPAYETVVAMLERLINKGHRHTCAIKNPDAFTAECTCGLSEARELLKRAKS